MELGAASHAPSHALSHAPSHEAAVRELLARGPLSSKALQQRLALSQPTVSRALAALAARGDELVRLGSGRSSFYSLRDPWPELPQLPVRRVDEAGRVHELGLLVPIKPAGFVLQGADGTARLSDGLPWWLADLRPQGFLGRAFAQQHAAALGLPAAVHTWTDRHVLRALATQGFDGVGNLLVGDTAREQFLRSAVPAALPRAGRGAAYARRAAQALAGDVPGSSAGGEQPKFTAYAATASGPAHVLVKFSLPEANPLTERWCDLLLAEHLALQVLHGGGLAAARSELIEHGTQRFLQLERFDRIGALGRRALHSLGSLDDEFTGDRSAPWPVAVERLVQQRLVEPPALPAVQQLYAFGVLIANTDMHMGNLSFFSAAGQVCALAPAYDMLPMALAPTAAGALRDALPPLQLPSCVPLATWHPALALAREWLAQLQAAARAGHTSRGLAPALAALQQRLDEAAVQVGRIAP
jgi:hypothetical protein